MGQLRCCGPLSFVLIYRHSVSVCHGSCTQELTHSYLPRTRLLGDAEYRAAHLGFMCRCERCLMEVRGRAELRARALVLLVCSLPLPRLGSRGGQGAGQTPFRRETHGL